MKKYSCSTRKLRGEKILLFNKEVIKWRPLEAFWCLYCWLWVGLYSLDYFSQVKIVRDVQIILNTIDSFCFRGTSKQPRWAVTLCGKNVCWWYSEFECQITSEQRWTGGLEEATTRKTEWRETVKRDFISTQMSIWKVWKSKGLMFTILLLIWLSYIRFSASSRKTKLNSVRYA